MHSIEYLTNNFEEASGRLARRGYELSPELLEVDADRKRLAQAVTEKRQVFNEQSREIGQLVRGGELGGTDLERKKEEQLSRKGSIAQDEEALQARQEQLRGIVLGIPNFPADHTPDGKDSSDNPEIKRWGQKPNFDFSVKDHVEIGTSLGIIDLDRGATLAASRFSVLHGKGSVLQRALVSMMLDIHRNNGYEEVTVPYMVNRATMTGTGQLPKFEFDLFKTEVEGKELFLVPTAEVPVTNLHAGDVLPESQLPVKYCCYSECFRGEAGSAGRDTKGILRQHQFPKVELVHFTKPEDSWNELETLTLNAEEVLQTLGLHYRVVSLCTGDIGFSAHFTYDLEVWLPGQDKYREISSCSNCGEFQARRANIKFKRDGTKKPEFVHTLNGSGLAVGRTMIAILEQYQREDGSVVVPEALQRYTGFSVIDSK